MSPCTGCVQVKTGGGSEIQNSMILIHVIHKLRCEFILVVNNYIVTMKNLNHVPYDDEMLVTNHNHQIEVKIILSNYA